MISPLYSHDVSGLLTVTLSYCHMGKQEPRRGSGNLHGSYAEKSSKDPERHETVNCGE